MLKSLFEHISRTFPQELTVSDAARMVHMSLPQLMKTFKKVVETTLVAYLNHVRISSAAGLLNETALTIAEIANEIGFSDQSFFDRQFKRLSAARRSSFAQKYNWTR